MPIYNEPREWHTQQMTWVGATIAREFWEAYQRHRNAKQYKGKQLPILHRAWALHLIETKPPIVAVEYHSGYFNPAAIPLGVAYADEEPNLSGVTTIERAIEVVGLGEVADARFCSHINTPFFSGVDFNKVKDFAASWGVELADRHIANTYPDVEIARDRMTTAYSKLFELENRLRVFVESILSAKYGNAWWQEALSAFNNEVRSEIRRRERVEQHCYLDVLSKSETRFLDFSHFRVIMLHHKGLFEPCLPDFKAVTDLLRDITDFRNRIGHVNTLSDDNGQDFLRMATRLIANIGPYSPLR